ncbi:MAG: hypothetical protein CFE24_01835 [Flavobacterium sp. BFFFF2]|nr:MAG: hypothetical protein CFE24_01835 [Flavobacterium sp. BFFFF2]
MNAIRQYIEVKNNTFNVVLPEGFTAKTVEVIIMPADESDHVPDWHKEIVAERLNNPLPLVDGLEMIADLTQITH